MPEGHPQESWTLTRFEDAKKKGVQFPLGRNEGLEPAAWGTGARTGGKVEIRAHTFTVIRQKGKTFQALIAGTVHYLGENTFDQVVGGGGGGETVQETFVVPGDRAVRVGFIAGKVSLGKGGRAGFLSIGLNTN